MNRDLVVLVDERGNNLLNADGSPLTSPKMEAHKKGLLHRAVSIFVFNKQGELLLQKRAEGKYHSAGKWSNTCCTHPFPNEAPLKAAARRLQEEMGLTAELAEAFTFLYKADLDSGLTENEFDHVFFGACDAAPKPDKTEVSDWRWVGLKELEAELAERSNDFTYWLKVCFPQVLGHTEIHRATKAKRY